MARDKRRPNPPSKDPQVVPVLSSDAYEKMLDSKDFWDEIFHDCIIAGWTELSGNAMTAACIDDLVLYSCMLADEAIKTREERWAGL